jgi:hypothetical protein
MKGLSHHHVAQAVQHGGFAGQRLQGEHHPLGRVLLVVGVLGDSGHGDLAAALLVEHHQQDLDLFAQAVERAGDVARLGLLAVDEGDFVLLAFQPLEELRAPGHVGGHEDGVQPPADAINLAHHGVQRDSLAAVLAPIREGHLVQYWQISVILA